MNGGWFDGLYVWEDGVEICINDILCFYILKNKWVKKNHHAQFLKSSKSALLNMQVLTFIYVLLNIFKQYFSQKELKGCFFFK